MDVAEHDEGDKTVWVYLGRDRQVRADQVPPPLMACMTLVDFMNWIGGRLVADTTFQQLVVGTLGRSFGTFLTICETLYDGNPIQGAMLCRPLFEDVVVAHWLLYNDSDPQWLVDRFERHREAIALYQQKLSVMTEWGTGPSLVEDLKNVKSRQNELFKEFGSEAQRNWWDPGKNGRGEGRPIGLRGVAAILEDVAASGVRFHPRFAGGDEPVLRRMELVVGKWFSQTIHHTALGLPVDILGQDQPPVPAANRSYLVAFCAFWLFAQQLYSVHELYGRATPELDRLVYDGMKDGFGAPEDTLHW